MSRRRRLTELSFVLRAVDDCLDKVLCVLYVLMFMHYYTVCYFTCIFYAVVRQVSKLFLDKIKILYSVFCCLTTTRSRSTKHRPGIEPGSPAWLASILPLDHQCFNRTSYCINWAVYGQVWPVHNGLRKLSSLIDKNIIPITRSAVVVLCVMSQYSAVCNVTV